MIIILLAFRNLVATPSDPVSKQLLLCIMLHHVIYLFIYLFIFWILSELAWGCLPSEGIWPPRTIWGPLGFAHIWPGLLSMKEGSFFCFVLMRSTELACFRSCSWCLSKALDEMRHMAWFHVVWTCGAKVFEYWVISSLIIKFNRRWKFQRNWNVPLGCWKDLDEKI